jgi:hypothetical protein
MAAEGANELEWTVIDPLLRRYLADRRVEPLSFVRSAGEP